MDDWVRVPREPTDAMVDAAIGYIDGENVVGRRWKINNLYRAMLAAAPAAQADDEIVMMPSPPIKRGVGHVVRKVDRAPLQIEGAQEEAWARSGEGVRVPRARLGWIRQGLGSA